MFALLRFTGALRIWQSSGLRSTSCPKTRPERQTTETGWPESKNRRESATLPLLFPMSPMPAVVWPVSVRRDHGIRPKLRPEAFVCDWPVHMQRALDLAETVLTACPNLGLGVSGAGRSGDLGGLAQCCRCTPCRSHGAGSGGSGGPWDCLRQSRTCAHHGKTGPCSEALIAAGVATVVIPMQDPHPAVSGKGIAQLEEAGVEVIMMVISRTPRV